MMEPGSALGRWLIVAGLMIAAAGSILTLIEKWPALGSAFRWIGRLPGDISITREQFSVYIPIATSLLFSILLSLVLYILSWLLRR
jgi:hypothetical protein